jgi:threonine dehydrogenase-like Zn-dependent dehydrogenase
MRQLTLTGERTLEWLEVPKPVLSGNAAAIVRPIAVAVCDFDRAVVAGRYPALPFPIAVGHEIVAEVVEIGPEVRNIAIGMQVVLPLHINCGGCPNCAAHRTNSCTSRPAFSNYGLGLRAGDWGGGMSDFLSVPFADAMALPVPDGLTAVDCAAVGCNLVDLYRTIAPYLATFPDPTILIVGGHAHNMALYGVVIAQALGVKQIAFLDDDAKRLAAAAALGALPVNLSEPAHRNGYNIVVDCSGDPERLAIALSRVGPDGVCTPVWPYAGSAKLPVGAMFLRNATLVTGQPHARANMDPVLQLMRDGKLCSTAIPVEILPWEDAPEKFGSGEIKRIFVRD